MQALRYIRARSRLAAALAATACSFALAGALAACAPAAPAAGEGAVPARAASIALSDQSLAVSFEEAQGEVVIVHVSTQVFNRGPNERAVAWRGLLELVDLDGERLSVQPLRGGARIAEGGSQPVEVSAVVPRGQLESVGGARLVYACASGPEMRFFCQLRAQPVAGARNELLESEAQREAQARLDAWYGRFPVGDYSDTLLIGDSIMQNSSASLYAALPGVTVNADAGRTLEEGGLVFENQSPDKGVLDHVRADAGAYGRYVIGTGNNDVGGMSLAAAEEIVSCLGPDKEIYFVTEAVRGGSYGMETTNDAIWDLVARYDNVHAIDWAGLVAGSESYYLADAVHPRTEREPDYAACVKQGLDTPYPR